MKTRYRELKIALVDNQDENFDVFFSTSKYEALRFNLPSPFSRFQKLQLAAARYIQRLRTWQGLAHSGTLRAPRNPILIFLIFSLGNLGYFTCTFDLKMFPLTLKLIFKVARCVGDHVDISNSAGSSDSAEESFILLNQMVLTGCVTCTLNMPI